ncbi:hypothetical protein BV20DRAFT_909753, partial [Pilatotrama ljubarskyi]
VSTHTFFEIVRSVLDKNTESLRDAGTERDRVARSVIVKIVNALSAASEMGGPAVCAALLGHPDHYTNEKFKVFYWYAYVQHALETGPTTASKATVTTCGDTERVVLGHSAEGIVMLNKVNDYVLRPRYFARWSLYDFLRLTDVRKLTEKEDFLPCPCEQSDEESSGEDASSDSEGPRAQRSAEGVPSAHRFLRGHPHRDTHGVFVRSPKDGYILNFVGRGLPRADKGDRETYCQTMLVFFCPSGWRTGQDLLGRSHTWSESFELAAFGEEHLRVMKNMGVLYECRDARDDYSA